MSFHGPNQGRHQMANMDSILRSQARNASWIIYQLANKDSRIRTHAKKSQLIHTAISRRRIRDNILRQKKIIHTSTGERGFELTFSRKNNQLIHTPTVEQGLEITFSRKTPYWFIHQMANDDSRLHSHKPQKIIIYSYINWRTSILDTHQKSKFMHTSTCKKRFQIKYTRKKVPIDLYINWQTRIREYVLKQKFQVDSYSKLVTRIRDNILTQKISVDSYTNWWRRIRDYVLPQKISVDGERLFKITFSRKIY